MTNVNHTQLSKVLPVYYGKSIPVMVHGTMGIGKSSIIKQVAKGIAKDIKLGFIEGEPDGEDKFGFIDVRISQLEPSDLRGLPDIRGSNEEAVTKWITPNWLPKNPKSKGILFFDELNLAPPSIQASAYQLVLDRRIGDYKLPDGWVIMSAGNTSSDKANVYDLPAPLANRFTHLDLQVPSKDEWVNWALKNDIDANILSFLSFKPSYLYKFDRNNKDKAFATPRSWEYVSKLIKDVNTLEEKEILIASAVGNAIAVEFMAFIKLQKKINLKEIFDNPKSVKDIKEIDIKYSLLGALVEKYKETPKLFNNLIEVADNLDAEFGVLLLRYMKEGNKDFIKDHAKSSKSQDLLKRYAKYFS